MNKLLKCILITLLINSGFVNSFARPHTDDTAQNIHLADPTIFYNRGYYYLYGTVEDNANEGFLVYTSADMKTWKLSKMKGDVFGTANFWAPQVLYYHNRFYMAYLANENIAIAQSESPLGPFTQNIKQPLAAPVKQIDPFVFIDNDGKKYLYHVRLSGGNKLFVAQLTDDFSAIKPNT